MHKFHRAATPALIACALSVMSSPARADDDWQAQREAERLRDEFDRLGKDLPVTPADPGLDTAKVRPPPWCAQAGTDLGSPSPSSLVRTIEAARRYSNSWDAYFDAARTTCVYPKQPSIQKAVQIIEQSWINMTGLPEAQALETFEARLDKDKFEADKTKLCDGLTVSDEVEGQDKAFMTTRRALLCAQMWTDTDVHIAGDLVTYFDTAEDIDPLVRLALVVDHSRIAFRDTVRDAELLGYVMDQVDYQALAPGAVTKLLDTAPYKGNTFARAVILESLGRARMSLAALDALVKKKTSDADWKELLVTAPQRGVTAWQTAAAKWKAQLARSNEFEHTFWGPSRKAVKGCWKTLRADFVEVAKTLSKSTATEFQDALSDPVASLLFSRLVACASIDEDKNHASRLLAISRDVRYARGPRMAAYYEALSALGTIVEDRTKFSVTPSDYRLYVSSELYNRALDANNDNPTGKYDSMGFVGDSGVGIVKAVKKVADGVEVTFVTEKHQEMQQSCVNTNKIYRIDDNGTLIYYQKCKDTGYVTVDTTPGGFTLPAEWAENIKKGALVQFDTSRGAAPKRIGLPLAVYADKSKKKLVNWMGIGL